MILAHQKRINEYRESGWWGNKTLLDCFKEHCENHPDRTFLVDPYDREDLLGTPPQRFSYRELDKTVDAVATGLLSLGIGKDDVVMVQLPNCWELIMLYLAVSRAGAVISPLPVQWRQKELEYIAQHTEAKAIITVNSFKEYNHLELARKISQKSSFLKHVLSLEQVHEMAERPADTHKLSEVHVDADAIFTICWTSGTEAEPKGCPLSHNNWMVLVDLQIQSVNLYSGDVILAAGPLVNMASTGGLFLPCLKVGGTLVIHHPFNPQVFIEQMMKEKVNYTILVPAVANMIVKHPQVDQFNFSSARSITMGSAPPSLFVMQEFKRRWDTEINNIWAQNEGTGIVSGPNDVPDLEKRVDHLPQFGKPGVKWASEVATDYVVTKLISPETGQEVNEVGEVGELAYRSPSVIPGYYKRPDLDEKSFDKDGFFYTGDLFQVKDDNCIGFFDRKKDIIIRGGFNISAQEIENTLLAHPKVSDVAAVGMPDEKMGERICVFVVPLQGEEFTFEDMKSYMEDKMAVYKIPEKLEITNAIPRNPVGKVMKGQLRKEIKKKMQG